MPLIDGFVGTAGTLLTATTANNGSTYTRAKRDGGLIELVRSPSGNIRHQAQIGSNGLATYSNNTTPPGADYEVAGIFKWNGETGLNLTTSSIYRIGFGVRYDGTANNGYGAVIRYAASGGTRIFYLINLTAATYSGVGSQTNLPLTEGHSYCIIIKAEGTTISAGILNLTTNRWLASNIFGTESATPVFSAVATGVSITDARIPAIFSSQNPEAVPSDTNGFALKQWHLAASNVISEIPKITVNSAPTEGFDAVASSNFTIGYTGIIPTDKNLVVNLSDGGLGGTFTPSSVTLDNTNTTRTFTYTPAALAEAAADISATLTFSADAAITATAPYRIFTPKFVFTTSPSLSWVNEPSSTFTVGLNGAIASLGSDVVVSLSDGSSGTFTPSSVTLSVANPTRTFTYTAASTGVKALTLTATNIDTKTHQVTVGNKPTALTLTAPNPASGKLGSYSNDFELSVNGLLINDINVTLSDGNKNTEMSNLVFKNTAQSTTPVQSIKFKIRPRNLETLTITATATGLTSSNTNFQVLAKSNNYTKSLVFSDNFNRANNADVGNGWIDNNQYSISSNQLLTTNSKQTAPLVLYSGTTLRAVVRATLDDSFTITTDELDGFWRTNVGESVRSLLGEIPTSTISSKPNNQTLVLSNKPTVFDPKDLLRGVSVKDAQISTTFTPSQGFNWRPENRRSVRLVLRKQSGVDAKYFVEVFAELQQDNSLKVYGNLYKKVTFRELPDKIHECFAVLPNAAHSFTFTAYSHGLGTILELSATNTSTNLETFFFKIVDGEPTLQSAGDVGLSHTGIVNIDDFFYYNITKIKRKIPKYYYVDVINGNNSNDGTSVSPFQTLQYALTKHIDNSYSVFLIRPGTYSLNNNETAPLIIPDGVSLIGETEAPIIQGSIKIDGTLDSSLINLKFDGNNYSSKLGLKIENVINFLFQNIEISKFTETGLYLQRIVSSEFSGCKIVDCSYSNLTTSIPVGSTELQTSAMRSGFIYNSKIANFNIDTLSYRGGQAFEAWANDWERY